MLTYIDEDFLHALSTEISLERFIDEKKADALLSKIASQAASMFTSLNEEVKNFQGKGIIDCNGSKLFVSLAQCYRAQADNKSLAKGAHRSASSFSALFSHASSTLPTDAGPSILDRIESRSQFCTERENEAQRENNLAYNAVVPSTEAPPPIKIACEATPIPIQEIYGSPDGRKAIRADVLMKLIPPSVHGSAGVHSEEKTKLVRKEVENAENAEVEVRSALEATGVQRWPCTIQ
ncbi:BRO1 domain-containing protein [Pisolithus sp. B1]|nr:BRO1 domain-containing protein [Pisolithus sp. B1]